MRYQILLVLCFSTGLLCSCTLVRSGVSVSPTPTMTAIKELVAPTVTPSVDPTTTPSPTAAPTLDPGTVIDIAAAGQVSIEERDLDPLCLRWEDTDGDGEPEWLGVYLRPTDPPQLEGFVLDGQGWYQLRSVEEEQHGLGKYPVCQLEANDINADGRVEIAIWGHAETTVELLHIFAWRDSRYEEMASFQGDAGLEMVDIDGNPGREIIARHNAGDGLAWETIHTWDGRNYVWTWERYRWLYADHPHAYLGDDPAHAVISFYLALDSRDMRAAYELLGSEAQASQPYVTWAAGFDTTLAVEVGSVHEIGRPGGEATVTAQVRSYDNLGGYIIGRLWDVTWSAVREGEAWRLDRATVTELSRWEAPYFR